MGIDMHTLIAAAAVTELLFALMLASTWSHRRTEWPLIYWSLGSFCAAISAICFVLRGQIPDFIGIAVANVLAYAALALRLAGLRSFAGQAVRLGRLMVPPLLIGVLFAFREPLDLDVTRRVMIVGIVGLGYGVLMLVDLMRAQREEALVMRRVVIVLIGLQTLNDVVRLIDGTFYAFAGNDFMNPANFYALLLLNVLCLYGVLNLATFMMIFERHENRLVHAATIDVLTGLLTRSRFEELAQRQIARNRHAQQPAAVLVMDLDHFKRINDRHGHDAGDRVLRAFAHCARNHLRPTDLLSRPGGEEFWALLPQADLAEATQIARRIGEPFRSVRVDHDGQRITATVSIGVAEVRADETLQSALARADLALYRAKREGRDRVAAATPPDAPHLAPATVDPA